MMDPLAQTIVYTYDAANEITGTLRADGVSTFTSYDLDGRVITQTNGLGVATNYGYDALGRTTAMTNGLGRVTEYGYDPVGNRTSLIDPMGRTTLYGYDLANRIEAITYTASTTPDVHYTYDADGNRETMRDGTGITAYGYDTLDRTTTVTDGARQTLGYAYDAASEPIRLTYPGGQRVGRAFDALGRITSVTDWLGHTSSFGYDGDSHVVTATYPNTSAISLTYNLAGDLTVITDTVNGAARWAFGYDRNPFGQVRGVTDTLDGVARTYGYDALHRLTENQQVNGGVNYGYDAAHNLTGITDTIAGAASALSYDRGSELTVLTTTVGAATNVADYTYDSNGNRTGRNATTSAVYGWDAANQLITSSVGGAPTTTYAYNGDGVRQSKVVSGNIPVTETWDMEQELPQLVQDGNVQYIIGPLGPLESISGTTPTYYYQDQRGSTRGLMDNVGHTIGTYSYDAYGNVTGHVGVNTALQYAGQYTDVETGLQYLRARYYDPATAQFLTRDPLVAQTQQPYAYALDDPLDIADPSGLCSASEASRLQAGATGPFSRNLYSLVCVAVDVNPTAAHQFARIARNLTANSTVLVLNYTDEVGRDFGGISALTGGAAFLVLFVPGAGAVASPALGVVSTASGAIATGADALHAATQQIVYGRADYTGVILDAGGHILGYVGRVGGRLIVLHDLGGHYSERLGAIFEQHFSGLGSLAFGGGAYLSSNTNPATNYLPCLP